MTMAEVYDAISDGELPVEEVTKAMKQMTSEGGQYFGLMEKQSKTLNGMLSTLSDTVQMKLGEAFQFVNDAIVALLPNVISFIENLDVQEAAKYIGVLVASLTSLLGVVTAVRGVIALFNLVTFIQGVGGLSTAIANLAGNIAFVLTTIAPVVATFLAVAAVIAAVVIAVKTLWETNEYFAESVTNLISGISDILTNVYESIVKPIFENLVEVLMNIYEEGIKPVWDSFVEFVYVIVTKASELLDAVMPVIDFFVAVFGPMIVSIINTVVNSFGSMISTVLGLLGAWLGNLGELVSSVIDVFKGIVNFVVGVFTLDWKKAWQGIVDIFGGIFGGIIAIAKAPLNGVIGIINGAIGALNSISIEIPDWVPVVGGQKWGLDLPKIPYLEKGGILKKGQRGFLEGNGAEAVVPLERNKYWVNAVAKEFARIMPEIKGGNTNILNFYQPVSTPDEFARQVRLDKRMGLIG